MFQLSGCYFMRVPRGSYQGYSNYRVLEFLSDCVEGTIGVPARAKAL